MLCLAVSKITEANNLRKERFRLMILEASVHQIRNQGGAKQFTSRNMKRECLY